MMSLCISLDDDIDAQYQAPETILPSCYMCCCYIALLLLEKP